MPRRKKGGKCRHGRGATPVVMSTLRGGDGCRLDGPVNKEVFGTFGARESAPPCIEVNGDWDGVMRRGQEPRNQELQRGQGGQIRSKSPTRLPGAA